MSAISVMADITTDKDDGLNGVPKLLRKPLPKCNRRRRRRSHIPADRHLSNYNGNYEGDRSMFRCRCHRIQTDTDTDCGRKARRVRKAQILPVRPGPVKRFCKYLKDWLLPEQRIKKVTACAEVLQNHAVCQRMSKVMRRGTTVAVFVIRCMLLIMAYFGSMTRVLWGSKAYLRQVARRLLWKMTLAKCDDVAFFGLILLLTPLTFAISVFGFFLSSYCAVKDLWNRL